MLGAPVIVIPPAGAVISIEDARTLLRVDGVDLDAEIRLQAAVAEDDIEAVTGLRLINQRVKVLADAFADLARLNVGPIRAVVSIAYRESGGGSALVPEENYELFGAPLEQGVRLVGGASWPAAAAGSIEISLDVGYGATGSEVEPKLQWAAMALLRASFTGTPADIENLIANHRIWL